MQEAFARDACQGTKGCKQGMSMCCSCACLCTDSNDVIQGRLKCSEQVWLHDTVLPSHAGLCCHAGRGQPTTAIGAVSKVHVKVHSFHPVGTVVNLPFQPSFLGAFPP